METILLKNREKIFTLLFMSLIFLLQSCDKEPVNTPPNSVDVCLNLWFYVTSSGPSVLPTSKTQIKVAGKNGYNEEYTFSTQPNASKRDFCPSVLDDFGNHFQIPAQYDYTISVWVTTEACERFGCTQSSCGTGTGVGVYFGGGTFSQSDAPISYSNKTLGLQYSHCVCSCPNVIISSPTTGQSGLTAGSNLVITANAVAPTGGTISYVEFYAQRADLLPAEILISTVYNPGPYNATWNNIPAGTYRIWAKAFLTSGKFYTGAYNQITIN